MISKKLAKQILDICVSTGGDFAEIFAQRSRTNSISYLKVSTLSSSIGSILVGIESNLGRGVDTGNRGAVESNLREAIHFIQHACCLIKGNKCLRVIVERGLVVQITRSEKNRRRKRCVY